MAGPMAFLAKHKAATANPVRRPKLHQKAAASSDDALHTSEYSIYLSQCKADWDALKAEPDHAERDRRKPALIEKYSEFLTHWIAEGESHQNDVLIMNLIWAADSADWTYMFELADCAVKTHQVCTLFKRDPVHIAADAVFIASEKQFKADGSKLPAFDTAFDFVLSKEWEINSSLKARYYKLAAELETDQAMQLEYYKVANELKNDIGVKGRISKLEKKLPSPQASGSTSDKTG